MGWDGNKRTLLGKLIQHGHGQCGPLIGIGPHTRFVNDDEALFIRMLHHMLKVAHVGREGTQASLNVLIVTDLGHDVFENRQRTPFRHWDMKTRLSHEAQKAERF